MDKIGPSFGSELRAAGVPLEGFAWGADGQLTFGPDVPQSVRDQVAAVLAAHDPSAPAPPASDGLTVDDVVSLLADQQGTTVDQLLTRAKSLQAAKAAPTPAQRME